MQILAERKPYPAKVDGQETHLFRNHADRVAYHHEHPEVLFSSLGLLAIAYFHDPAYRDYEYVAAGVLNEAGDEVWTKDFGLRAMMVWMVNFARDEEERRMLHLANRDHGSYFDNYHWQPDVIIELEPSEAERESFIEHETQDLYTSDGMPVEFFEGNA